MHGNPDEKSTPASWKFKEFAVSCTHAVEVEACTALGKPKDVGTSCPNAGIVMHGTMVTHAMAITNIAPAIDLPIA